MKKKQLLIGGVILAFLAFSWVVAGAGEGPKKVKYPDGYRNWTHVKSMVIQEGHPLYETFGGIHHIYANDKALKALKKGLPFPKDAVLVFDLLEAKAEDKTIGEGNRKVLGVMQRDAKRFAGTGGWGFEGFKGDTRERVVTDMQTCFGCHEKQKEKGYVFSTYRR
ncbi:MAG: cytochrome P460 family protein [Deltaproteobacteria bacterium]|nr:cytochrome P460 family protein [Deltaproteobacteria bacterium]